MTDVNTMKGDIITCGPSMCEECNRCESVFVDCEICELAEVTVIKADKKDK